MREVIKMRTYMIMKNGKYVKDYTDGKALTTSFKMAEKYTEEKAALKAAQQYGKNYKVVRC